MNIKCFPNYNNSEHHITLFMNVPKSAWTASFVVLVVVQNILSFISINSIFSEWLPKILDSRFAGKPEVVEKYIENPCISLPFPV